MLIIAFKPGHDGGIVAVENGRLLYSLESEEDSFARYSFLAPEAVSEIAGVSTDYLMSLRSEVG
ncbi:hypothetical protein [Nocardia gipuzkoensis]